MLMVATALACSLVLTPPPGPPGADWSVERLVGPPDATPGQDHVSAWATAEADRGLEWVELTWKTPQLTAEIVVHQTLNPGAVARVEAIDASGEPTLIWQGVDRAQRHQLSLPLSKPAMVSRVRIELDTRRVAGWNELDAVGLVDRRGEAHWADGARASSSYADSVTVVGPFATRVGKPVVVQHLKGTVSGTLKAVHGAFLELVLTDGRTVFVALSAVVTLTDAR
jgi:hypothetical protein